MDIKNTSTKATGFLNEFKTFAVKGNVIELAVAVVIGTAFNKIIDSLVNDVIMQAIAMIFGKPDFSTIMLGAVKIGSFINSLVNFIIVALSIFVAIKFVYRFIPSRPAENTESQKISSLKYYLLRISLIEGIKYPCSSMRYLLF